MLLHHIKGRGHNETHTDILGDNVQQQIRDVDRRRTEAICVGAEESYLCINLPGFVTAPDPALPVRTLHCPKSAEGHFLEAIP